MPYNQFSLPDDLSTISNAQWLDYFYYEKHHREAQLRQGMDTESYNRCQAIHKALVDVIKHIEKDVRRA